MNFQVEEVLLISIPVLYGGEPIDISNNQISYYSRSWHSFQHAKSGIPFSLLLQPTQESYASNWKLGSLSLSLSLSPTTSIFSQKLLLYVEQLIMLSTGWNVCKNRTTFLLPVFCRPHIELKLTAIETDFRKLKAKKEKCPCFSCQV